MFKRMYSNASHLAFGLFGEYGKERAAFEASICRSALWRAVPSSPAYARALTLTQWFSFVIVKIPLWLVMQYIFTVVYVPVLWSN